LTKASTHVNATHAGEGEEALLFFKLFVELKAGAVRPTGAVARWTIPRVVQSTYPTIPIGMGGGAVAARLLSFPHPVNEVSARLVAGGVVLMCAVAITLDQRWLIAVIAYGFVARVSPDRR
jgi:hypothetical protein